MYLEFITLLLITVTIWRTTQGTDTSDDATWRCENGLPDTSVVLGFQGKCFQFVDREVYWTQANDYCHLYGGRLVKMDDPHTNTFIVRSLNNLPWRNKGVWIGLHDRNHEHHWEWVTESTDVGDTVRWTNWARGHPKAFLHTLRDCIRMVRGRHQDWKWHETFCSALNWKYKFICQYPMKAKTPPPQNAGFYQDASQDTDLGMVPKLEKVKPNSQENAESAYRHVKETTAVKETVTQGMKVTIQERKDNVDYYNDYTDGQKVDLGELIKPMALKEEQMENNREITFVVLACTIGVVSAIIIIAILLVRRRRKRKLMEDKTLKIENPMYNSSCDNNNDGQGPRGRVQNEYVVNVYSNPMPLAVRLLHARSAGESSTDSSGVEERNNTENNAAVPPSDGDGYEEPLKSDYLPMDGNKGENDYDRPKSNFYDEIPDLYSENLYETLDDINVAKNESEA